MSRAMPTIHAIRTPKPIPYGGRVFIRAMRNVKPEEEITYDYGTDYLARDRALALPVHALPPARAQTA